MFDAYFVISVYMNPLNPVLPMNQVEIKVYVCIQEDFNSTWFIGYKLTTKDDDTSGPINFDDNYHSFEYGRPLFVEEYRKDIYIDRRARTYVMRVDTDAREFQQRYKMYSKRTDLVVDTGRCDQINNDLNRSVKSIQNSCERICKDLLDGNMCLRISDWNADTRWDQFARTDGLVWAKKKNIQYFTTTTL
jgi:hypothetical protein